MAEIKNPLPNKVLSEPIAVIEGSTTGVLTYSKGVKSVKYLQAGVLEVQLDDHLVGKKFKAVGSGTINWNTTVAPYVYNIPLGKFRICTTISNVTKDASFYVRVYEEEK